jgi:L-histidine N-alpha-methyltransferase
MPETLVHLYEATRAGLEGVPKELPPVWLYDERGSLLYEEITRLPDYYLPRREAEILRAHASEIAELTQAGTLIELGSGNSRNTRFLLDALALERFVPLDVSEEMLLASAEAVAAAYPRISVEPVVGDFERDLATLPGKGERLVALLGSTIGNLYPEQRARLLAGLAGEQFLVGIDLVKDVARLQAAYDDPGGVTEAFARNALTAVNRELGATFEQRRFVYEPRWDPEHEWMDVGFRALVSHTVSIPGLELELELAEGERLRVEVSSKFRRNRFQRELEQAGLTVRGWWTDSADDFAVVLAS